MLHGRAGAQGRQGSGRVPPRHADEDSRACWRCSISRPRSPAGASRCRRASAAASACSRRSAASSPPWWRRRSTSTARSICAASPRWSTPASPSIPTRSMAQIQGGLIFGLTAALYGEITIDKGRVQQSNFHDYRMLRIDQTPQDRGARHQERRGARRHRRDRRDRRPAGAAQRDLRRNRRRAAAPADRRETAGCGEKGMSAQDAYPR